MELSAARIEGVGWRLQQARVDWSPQSGLTATIDEVHGLHPQLPPISARLDCPRLDTRNELACRAGTLRLEADPVLDLSAVFDLHFQALDRWRMEVGAGQLQLSYNSADGRVAAEQLNLQLSGQLRRARSGWHGETRLSARSGQIYLEPVFLDFAALPAQLHASLRWAGGMHPVQIERLAWTQRDLGTLRLSGDIAPDAPLRRHHLSAELDGGELATLTELLVVPLLAGTRLDDLQAAGRIQATLLLNDGQPQEAALDLSAADVASTKLGLSLGKLSGALHWRGAGEAAPSQLQWQQAEIGELPLGAAQLQFIALPRGLRLSAPLRIPILDGALRVRTLHLDGLGSGNPSAEFNAELEPLDLALLGRSLGWPEFGGRLSGRLPGLQLRNRELSLDGELKAQVFDGDITVSGLRVLDPFGVLPRIRADLRLRRLDLEAITRAFSFGRISGRLDGDVEGLRLLGWRPVAMNARVYSTPGDTSRRRISQRAIDSLSSIGGGPTGLLSRGALSLFEDFAYARIGWSCQLDNGVCAMDGVAPADRGDGYVLVEGRLLPRIDVIGHSRQVAWDVFVQQLLNARSSTGVEVR